MQTYYVYIITNRKNGVLYTGMTNDLERRVSEHKLRLARGFAAKYHCHQLVYYEEFSDIWETIGREKQIKGWLRAKKIALIESMNPRWKDLSEGWFD